MGLVMMKESQATTSFTSPEGHPVSKDLVLEALSKMSDCPQGSL